MSRLTRMIVTIDGPAGSGKSTAARNLARTLGIAYLDTGATYRAATLRALRSGVDMTDEDALAAEARDASIHLVPDDTLRVLLDGADVTREIRTARVTDSAHHLASSPAVRDVLVDLQRRIGRELGDFVAEGRDQGSVVFPDADVKFYLTASARIRAERRCAEMLASGQDAEFDEVLEAIRLRDHRDRTREVGPLVRPGDAIVVDTSGRSPDDVLAELLRQVEALR